MSVRQRSQDPFAVHRLNAGWVVRLRWAAIAGQVVTIAMVHGWMHITLPLAALGTLVVLSVASNVAFSWWLRRTPRVNEGAIGGLMALDLCLFTGLLYFSGGPFNPFSSLYLVHLALGALVLSPRWTWSLVLLAVAANAALFVDHVPLAMGHGQHGAHHHGTDGAGEPLDMHLQGMWVAFGVTAGFIVYFLHRVTRTLADREGEIARIRERSARAERLASVATLAAGAAHELATPLSTIAVVAREIERSATAAILDDARLIREQVQRCRDILGQMAGDAGESPGEIAAVVTLGSVVEDALAPLEEKERVEIRMDEGSEGARVRVPARAVSQALRNVVQNALDASPPEGTVVLTVARSGGGWALGVQDRGQGMTPDVQEHATDPFFTTKEPGRGLGLGLFLARSVIEFLGGSLDIETAVGKGTRVRLTLPADAAMETGPENT